MEEQWDKSQLFNLITLLRAHHVLATPATLFLNVPSSSLELALAVPSAWILFL